jgi:cellulose biosynthesis protein BcsQ
VTDSVTQDEAKWLGLFNIKGGAGKSTTAWALALAASSLDFRVLVVDMDPRGWISGALGIPRNQIDLAQVLTGRAKVEQAIAISELGVGVLVGSEPLAHIGINRDMMLEMRSQIDPHFDIVIADSPDGVGRSAGLMAVCDRICIPTPLDRMSAIVSTDTMRAAESVGVLNRVGGLLPAIVRLRNGEPEDTEGREVFSAMRALDIKYGCMMVVSKQWSRATSLAAYPPPKLLRSTAVPLFHEVRSRLSNPTHLSIWMNAYSRERLERDLRVTQDQPA